MAYSIEQQPHRFTAASSPMVYIVKESTGSITGAAKFRYIVQVEISETDSSSFSTIAKIKLHKNSASVGIVDIHKIVRNYLEIQKADQNSTTNSIHSLGISVPLKPFSQTESQAVLVRVKGGYEKASSQSAAPVEELAPTGTYTSNISVSIPATTPYTKTASNVGGLDDDDAGNNMPLLYYINDTSAEDSYSFLTNAPTTQFVRGSSTSSDNVDELTICFKQGNGASGSAIVLGDKLEYMAIQYFDSSGSLIAGTAGSSQIHYFANSNANGGATAAQSNTAQEAILYFGCGTANLQTQSLSNFARPSNFTNWAYYRICGTTTNATTDNQPDDRCTKWYYFYRYGSGASVDDRHQSCTRYDNIRLAWRNRLGAWDYMNFRGKSTESVGIKRTDIARVPGTWDSATFSYNNWDGGKQSLFTEATRKLTINSDWLNEDEAVWLEELFTSINIQILGDDNIVYPVILTDKTYTKKTSVNNKIKIQYTIKLEYANKVRTNS
tara:strand:- start:4565 stop:6052 length:1488 start_codon:yes stop_codon:yes gene_type:complete